MWSNKYMYTFFPDILEISYSSSKLQLMGLEKKFKEFGAGAMAQLDNPPTRKGPASHVSEVMSWMLHFPSSSFCVEWENSDGLPNALGLCSLMRDPKEALGFRFA